jgi:hypothetical protein
LQSQPHRVRASKLSNDPNPPITDQPRRPTVGEILGKPSTSPIARFLASVSKAPASEFILPGAQARHHRKIQIDPRHTLSASRLPWPCRFSQIQAPDALTPFWELRSSLSAPVFSTGNRIINLLRQ